MMKNNIRWRQRFENYCKAFETLQNAVTLAEERKLSQLEEQGLIQGFEFTFELAWKVLKIFLECQDIDVKFPRDAIKKGFQYEIIDDGDIWIDMLEKRNLMSHTYDEHKAHQAVELITKQYFQQLQQLQQFLSAKINEK